MKKCRLSKWFKKIDQFGEKFSFKYNSYDKYSTAVGGLFNFIFLLISLVIIIINSIPFFKKENFSLQFYTINQDTENHDLNQSFAFGIDCENRTYTDKAYEYFNLKFEYKYKITIYDKFYKGNGKTSIYNCITNYFED